MRRLGLLAAAVLAAAGVFAAIALAAGAPVPTTGTSSAVTSTGATIAGTVNPNGLPTTLAFDYGTSTAYGTSTPTQDAGSGTTPVDVTAPLTGLRASTTYHYRVSASNSSGTAAGADQTFTTSAAAVKPTATSQAATAITPNSATVGVSVNPGGQETQVVFDYGTSTGYGSTTPSQSAGAGTAAVTIKATIAGLLPGTTYHFRARATNATGTTNSSDRTFATAAIRKPAVTTGAASAITFSGATLGGSVDPNARPTTVSAQIGPTTAYGAQTAPQPVGTGDSAVNVKVPVGGLQPLTTYHYRLVATSDAGAVFGRDRTFKTAREPNALALTPSPATVVYGRSSVLAVTLSGSGSGGVALNLFASPFPFTGGLLPFAPGLTTDAGGHSTTTVAPRVTTRYRGTATVSGLAVTSPSVRVTVVPRVAARASRRAGGRVRFSAVIRPRGSAAVSLQRRRGDGLWLTVARTRAHAGGGVFSRAAVTRPRRPGLYRFHVKPTTRGLAAGNSAGVRVR